MMYKNTFKLLLANFTKVWRVLLYVLVTGAITIGLAIAVGFPIYKVLLDRGIFVEFSDYYMEFINHLDLLGFFTNIGLWMERFVEVIIENISTLWLPITGLVLMFIVIGAILVSVYKFATTSCVNYYMNSSVNHNFGSALVSHFTKNIGFQILNLIILLPINLGIAYLVIMSLNMLTNANLMFWAPFVAMAIFVVLNALKVTIFGGWIPAMIVKNKNVFSGLKECFRVMGRRFIYTFGSALAMILTLVFVNIFGGICTFGVGLIITIPATLVAIQIFNMVAYYTAIGQRYYVDATNVCAPKRQEFTDKFNNHKYIV